jgi:hypothetical protein
MLTQGGKECLDVNVWVELDGKDVRAMRKSSYLDSLARIEAVNQGSTFGHGAAEPLCESLYTL